MQGTVSVDRQGEVPVEKAVSESGPVVWEQEGLPKTPSATLVLGQPGRPAAVRTSYVSATGSCAPLVGIGQAFPLSSPPAILSPFCRSPVCLWHF